MTRTTPARRTVIALAVAAALTTGTATPTQAAAKPMGRPDLPAPRVDRVAPFHPTRGQADKARTERALAATAAAARRARAEQVGLARSRKATSGQAPVAEAATATMSLAAAGGPAGAGDYRATPLSPSASWTAGGSAGSFTWSYPLRVPAAAAGPAPELAISYDSGSVDGRLPSTNNQPSWVGEGFDLTASYVDRPYGSCDEDGEAGKYDLCWRADTATLVLNGQSHELVQDDTDGSWHLRDDDASTVQRLTGADNGARNGEHWQVTTGDGTRYVFGLSALPGADAATRTNSVWTVPVFGDDAGEPCHGATFADSACTQAWRWNLDYVVDTHGNAASYWYTAEHNNYAKNGDPDPGTDYVRGGHLTRIDYGQRAGSLFTATAGQRVIFDTAERCVAAGTGCDTLTATTKGNWPDVPYDAICPDGDPCTGNTAPSFFTRKRLVGVTTQVWDAATTAYRAVDSWSLAHSYLDPGDTGDTTDQTLWLDSLTHTGKAGADITLPPVRFSHIWLTNRVDGATDDILPLNKPRLYTITSETGADTIVNYTDTDCVPGTRMPAAPDDNTLRCFPVYWNPNGVADPQLDWFHKYLVTHVRTTDPTGGAPTMATDYSYAGGAAWRYNDDPVTPASRRTWSQWRGYDTVTSIVGDADAPTRSKTVQVFLRGMDGDKLAGGGARNVQVTGVTAPAITDSNQYAGFLRETVTYDGVAGPEVAGTVTDPWSRRTATRSLAGVTTEAHLVADSASHQRVWVTSGPTPTTRVRSILTTRDGYGMPTAVEDRGDDAATGDETCTRTWYARNPAAGITELVAREQKLATSCAQADSATLPADASTPGDVISDTATAYDTTTWTATQTPTLGEARWTGRAAGYAADGTPSWQRTATIGYDPLGRVTSRADATNNTTTTGYTPAAAGPLTSSTVTNAKAHTTTTTVDPAWGEPVKVVDPNSKLTEMTYDGLGRLTQVWLPITSRALGKAPNLKFGYQVSATGPSWVSTGTVKADGATYNTSYDLYDALLRPRQTQSPSPAGGRVIAETFYDARGNAATTYADIYDSTAGPAGALVGTVNGQAPAETVTGYDGANRPASTTFKTYGTTRWATTTSYTGDSTATTAPPGGSATREYTDARGQVTERREYAGTDPDAAAYTSTRFAYTPAGEKSRVTGPDGAVWTWSYDLFGRPTQSADPDKGTTSTGYTSLDQLDWTLDAAGRKLLYGYDELGRKTGLWATTKTDPNQLAAWTYDTVAKGQPSAATRYVGGLTGKAYTRKTTVYDNLYRPKTSQVVLPSTDPLVTAGVPATLSFSTSYNVDGTVQSTTEPAVAGLPSEGIAATYNAVGLPLTLSGTTGYLQGTAYSPVGDVQQLTLGQSASNPKKAWITDTYEPGTRRLTRSSLTDGTHPWMPLDLTYTQDPAGNLTAISDAATLGGTGKTDHQCFAYDGYQRLVEAWTPATPDCATGARTVANLAGAAPYWSSFGYTDAGLRTTETRHAAAGDTTVGYTYPAATAPRPHTATKTTTTAPGGAQTVAAYGYDPTGNTTTRPGVAAATQTLAWDPEGRMSRASEPAAGATPATSTDYLYDADGALLIRRPTSADGETVLYLGATEVHHKVAGATKTLSGQRYYTAGGRTIAIRKATAGVAGSTLAWLAGDHHGTAAVTLDATTQAITKRYTTPFGGPRGTQPAGWPDDKRFLGKPADPTTGLTHIGAREYDPALGRFLSVDPLMDLADAQSLTGYTYAANNPATLSDPTGLCSAPIGGQRVCAKASPGGPPNIDPTTETGSGGGSGSGGSGGGSGGRGRGGRHLSPSDKVTLVAAGYFSPSSLSPHEIYMYAQQNELKAAFVEDLAAFAYTGQAIHDAAQSCGLVADVALCSSYRAAEAAGEGNYGPAAIEGGSWLAGGAIGKFAGKLGGTLLGKIGGKASGTAADELARLDQILPRIRQSQAGHMFRDAPGHVARTPDNELLIRRTAADTGNYVGAHRSGTQVYAKTLGDGTQVWTEVRNGQIVNGGVNQVPRVWDATVQRLVERGE